ncbi:SOCS box domain-containing protein [Phthorimaea operculella]|nr:SOCS box domain-containing protein [Phthorimaea operculella]
MDTFMEFYFTEVFTNLDRDGLNKRFKRKELVEYFNSVIAGCAKGQDKTDDATCKNFVVSTLRYHNNCKSDNGDICLMGKYHNLLYVAMKLAFDWSLQDNAVVAALLDELYACEKTFERIFLGAIFGTSAPHFLAGWKSDFKDKEENVHALVYFLDHATNASLEYHDEEKTYRFIDVPLESCGRASPVRVVIQMGAAEMLMILLRFGATINAQDSISTNPVESILDRLNEYNRKYPYELVTCLKLSLRAIPRINFTIDKKVFKHLELPEDYNYQRKVALEKYGDILEDHLIPTSRCSLKPVELKHLCRCQVREMLWKNFELPFGIAKLPIPLSLQRYLDLFDD